MRIVVRNWRDGTGSLPNGGLWLELDARLVTRQRYLSSTVVAEKTRARDFDVAVSPRFERPCGPCRRVLDGHHSLEAARYAGEVPVLVEGDLRNFVLRDEGPLVDAVTRCSV